MGAELCSLPVASADRNHLQAPVSIHKRSLWGVYSISMGRWPKVCLGGFTRLHFTWQAQHFANTVTFLRDLIFW